MANSLKKAVFNLMEKAFTHKGFVLAVRKWQPESMYEIDLHLPDIDMEKWTTIPRLKCKVSEFEYRDYTPATWDVQKRICTLYIETEHQGDGSSWTKNLSAGDTMLCSAAHAAPLPARTGKILCLGDGSAMGHFLALKQLTNSINYPFEAAVFLNELYTPPASFTAVNPEFKLMMQPQAKSLEILHQFVENKMLSDYSSIYVTGYIPMVQGLRKILRNAPGLEAKVFAQGFWS
ncbi:siderophore-interacting protein [Pedobacter sp. L105]|uniref:siderophore-interacting protein n=1 Tax=Pedobacter sp. L105 TaxID=1641871 RepID=UPI00131E6639|nr:siderophore-interacting protein [Pedobacter sp. L105]